MNTNNDKKVQIHLEIEPELLDKIKKSKLKYAYIFQEGFLYITGRSQTNIIIEELKQKIDRLDNRISNSNRSLNEKLSEVKKNELL